FITGMLIFSHQLLVHVEKSVVATWLSADALRIGFWSVLGLLVLIPLFAVWRNIAALSAIVAEAWQMQALPAQYIQTSLKMSAAVALGAWLYALVPLQDLSGIGWIVIAALALAIVAL